MSYQNATTGTLAGLAFTSLLLYAISERSVAPVHAEAYAMKLRAVATMARAERAVAAIKRERGIAIDERNDPSGSGVVGPQFTVITTDRGVQTAKVLAAHPNFAAAVTQMMLRARVRPGDLVAIGVTGSLPGWNIAVLSACRAIGAEPVIITSVGSSMFGATDPELTWLDMEASLAKRGLWPYHSIAASLGGGGDVGRGLSPAGRQMLLDAIERNGTRLIDPPTLLDGVRQRVALYDSVATARGKRIKLYINVGGGVASLGGAQNARLIPAGLITRLAAKNYPNRGVINILADRGIPLVHMLDVEKMARYFGILEEGSEETVRPGKGLLFIKFRYNLWIVAVSAAALLLLHVVVLRLDIRQKILGQPHPERAIQP